MKQAFLAILNPAAGGGRCGREAPGVLGRLREQGIELELVETTTSGDAIRLAHDGWAAGYRRFLSIGGDGTAFEIINGLFPIAAEAGEAPELGFLPLGTGNSFLRDFTERGAANSLEAIQTNRSRPCDVLRLSHRNGLLHYINILSLGWVAEVNGLRGRQFSSFGEAGYVLSVLTMLAKLNPVPLPFTVAGQGAYRGPVTFLSINNSRFTGGKMMMAPQADTNDGLADILIVKPMSRLRLLSSFPKIFQGTHLNMPEIEYHRAPAIDFHFPHETDIMIDGEAMRVAPERVEVLPKALRILV